jgi:glycosyltransferase involved in cell wall biosynthesis
MQRSLRIGIDGRGIFQELDGIGRYSLNLIRGLASIDRKNEYVILKNREVEGKIAEEKNFHEVSVSYRHLSLLTPLYLPLLLNRFNLDIFHSLFFVGSIWGVESQIVTVHDLMALTFPGFFGGRSLLKEKAAFLYHRVFVPLSVRKSKKIIAVSQSTKSALVETLHVPPGKISVIYEGVDDCFRKAHTKREIEAFKIRKGLPDQYLLYVGNMKPYKNIRLMTSALSLLKRENQLRHKLVIAGKKGRFFPLVYSEVKDRELVDQVIFLDYVGDDELPLLFKNADMFLFPSVHEGFGLPALEAMSLGVSTIVSNASSLPEVVGDGALLVDPESPQSLANAILRISNDSKLRSELSRKGIERSRAFSWEKTAHETLKLYRDVWEFGR